MGLGKSPALIESTFSNFQVEYTHSHEFISAAVRLSMALPGSMKNSLHFLMLGHNSLHKNVRNGCKSKQEGGCALTRTGAFHRWHKMWEGLKANVKPSPATTWFFLKKCILHLYMRTFKNRKKTLKHSKSRVTCLKRAYLSIHTWTKTRAVI